MNKLSHYNQLSHCDVGNNP